jgi:hypothetical protein
MLSDTAKQALSEAYATRGKNKGMLLAKCPRSNSLAAAAWQGAMLSVNPFKASICSLLFMSDEQKAVRDEVLAFCDKLTRAQKDAMQSDRKFLSSLGVW